MLIVYNISFFHSDYLILYSKKPEAHSFYNFVLEVSNLSVILKLISSNFVVRLSDFHCFYLKQLKQCNFCSVLKFLDSLAIQCKVPMAAVYHSFSQKFNLPFCLDCFLAFIWRSHYLMPKLYDGGVILLQKNEKGKKNTLYNPRTVKLLSNHLILN